MLSLPARQKRDFSFWEERRGKILTRKGGLALGGVWFSHGLSMLDELVGKASYLQVWVLGITGRLPEARLAAWLEALFTCVSCPDPRIWCNQAGSLAGTMGASPVAGVCAGLLASDSRMYGPGTQIAGATFIARALEQQRGGMAIEEIITSYAPPRFPGAPPQLPGYIRPIASGDERIPPMERVTNELGFTRGPHLILAYEIEQIMLQKHNEGMNLLGYCAAFLCDQGVTAVEQYRIVSTMVAAGVLACHAEAADNPPHAFYPLRCEDIDYQGAAPRAVPERK